MGQRSYHLEKPRYIDYILARRLTSLPPCPGPVDDPQVVQQLRDDALVGRVEGTIRSMLSSVNILAAGTEQE